MVTFIIVIAVALFLYWSLVPASPRQPTLDDMINDNQRKKGNFKNVYLNALLSDDTLGAIYYIAHSPNDPKDKKVFSGTENECETYVANRLNIWH